MKVPFKSKLKRYKNIDNRNKAYHNLTLEEQRKEVAFDALSLIIENKLSPSRHHSNYWSYSLQKIEEISKSAKEFQEKLLSFSNKCTVCQRGAIMLSTIRLGNTISPFEFDISCGNDDNNPFGINALIYMEREYENDRYNLPYLHNTKEKLANILCNIISNGNFKYEDKTDYLIKWKIKL